MRFLILLATMLFTASALPAADKAAMGLTARNEGDAASFDAPPAGLEHVQVPERNEDAPFVPPQESVELHARDETDPSFDAALEA